MWVFFTAMVEYTGLRWENKTYGEMKANVLHRNISWHLVGMKIDWYETEKSHIALSDLSKCLHF